jgi:hypothetical protein
MLRPLEVRNVAHGDVPGIISGIYQRSQDHLWSSENWITRVVTASRALYHCARVCFCATLKMVRCAVIVLMLALVALLIALGMAALLFAAGISERHQHPEITEDLTSERKVA